MILKTICHCHTQLPKPWHYINVYFVYFKDTFPQKSPSSVITVSTAVWLKKYYKIQWSAADSYVIFWSFINHLLIFNTSSRTWFQFQFVIRLMNLLWMYSDLSWFTGDSTFLTMSYICFPVYSWNRSQIAVDQCKTVFKIFFITGHHRTCRDVGSFFFFFKTSVKSLSSSTLISLRSLTIYLTFVIIDTSWLSDLTDLP